MAEHVKFWRDRRYCNLELLHAHYVTHSFSRHIHDTFAIGIILAGAEGFTYRGRSHVARAGCVVIIHPGEVHTGHAATEAGWNYRMLYPDVCLLQQAAAEIRERDAGVPYFPEAVIADAEMTRLILRLHLALERSSSQLEQDSRMIWTMAQLVARHAGDRPSATQMPRVHPVDRVREYLEAHYASNPSLEELGAIANLSPFHLLRSFRKQVGLPPHEYLNQVRLWQARRLLSAGQAIAQVAQETGFADQSHLTRQFKRMLGVTPGQYRSPDAAI